MKDAYYKSAIAMRGTSCGTSGAISELRAATDLMSKGYHVFRSLSPSCPCDLVILTDHHFLKVEVRSARENLKSGRIYKNKNHKKDNPHMIDMYAFVAQNKIVYEPPLPTISY
jgi:Holliday junction resolvase-like predicted endonuclease